MAFKLSSLIVFFAIASGVWLWGGPSVVVDARGPFRCPRMIDCAKVCQGYPYRCVDGECICGEPPGKARAFNSASQLQPERRCAGVMDCKIICAHFSGKCVKGQCVCA